MNDFATHIKTLKSKQDDVALALGISQAIVSRLVNGKKIPSVELAVKIEDWSKGMVSVRSWIPEGTSLPVADNVDERISKRAAQ